MKLANHDELALGGGKPKQVVDVDGIEKYVGWTIAARQKRGEAFAQKKDAALLDDAADRVAAALDVDESAAADALLIACDAVLRANAAQKPALRIVRTDAERVLKGTCSVRDAPEGRRADIAAPAPPAALDAMTPEQVAGELAALGVPIDEAAATNSPVSLPLFRIARAAAEAAQREEGRTRRGKWESPEPDIADSLNDAFTRRRLPLTTGASARAFLATVLSCSGDRITGKYRGRSLPGPYVGQEASAPDLAALASALEAFVAPFATSLQERPASASIVHDGGYGVDGVQRRARSRSSSPRAVPAPVAPGGTAVDQTNFPVVAAPPRPAPRPTEAGTVPEQAHSRRRGTAPCRTGSATGPRVRTNNNVACPCRHAG